MNSEFGNFKSRYDFFNDELKNLKIVSDVNRELLYEKISTITDKLNYITEILEDLYEPEEENNSREEIDITSME